MRLGLGQFNASVGDIAGNVETMRGLIGQAGELGVDVLVFPEMCLCGYPPEDLLHKEHFLADNRLAVEQLAADSTEMTVLVGFAEADGKRCFNSLAVLQNGSVQKIYRKRVLPNYGVFDEHRYFQAGSEPVVINVKGMKVALTICEDIWQPEEFLSSQPAADLIVNAAASPFHVGKISERRQVLGRCARHFSCAVGYCNLVGGQDELVFDGRSMIVDATGSVVGQAKAFSEDLLVADISSTAGGQIRIENVRADVEHPPSDSEDTIAHIYEALLLGTRDYVVKNGFSKVIIGLSGGIDSSLVAAIAADAIGADNVVAVTMPSKFNSPETISDAEKTAENMQIKFLTIAIEDVLEKFNTTLGVVDGWSDDGVAYENLQARIRGSILMSLSNQFSYLVLTTGNKSETAVGYCTLYGDTAGGFAVIKDVPKTMVYELSRYVNKVHGRRIIPVSVIDRPPSAELKADQKDSDSLPDYELLDKILTGYIEQDKSVEQLTAEGLPEAVVNRVVRMVDRNEYKRRQSPPGIKITPKAFGKDRRMPITNRYTS